MLRRGAKSKAPRDSTSVVLVELVVALVALGKMGRTGVVVRLKGVVVFGGGGRVVVVTRRNESFRGLMVAFIIVVVVVVVISTVTAAKSSSSTPRRRGPKVDVDSTANPNSCFRQASKMTAPRRHCAQMSGPDNLIRVKGK